MSSSSPFLLVLVTSSLLAACSATTGDAASDSADVTAVKDASDTSCRVVLRRASLDTGAPVIVNGASWFVLTADVDVEASAVERGAVPSLRWIDQGGTVRTATSPVLVDGAGPSFRRFRFRLDHDTIQAVDVTSFESSHVSILPFVELDHVRWFDHNRVRGAFDTYTLWSGDTAGGLVPPPPGDARIGAGFAVADAPGVCR